MCSDDFSAIKYRMSPAKKARLVFILALVLLLLGALAVSITIQQLASSAGWVAHSYDVKAALGEFDSSLSGAARARFAYVHSGDDEFLVQYESSKSDVRSDLQHIRDLTYDNPSQEAIRERLQKATDLRIQSLDESVALQKSGHSNQDAQDRFTQDGVKIMSDIANIVQQMQDEEQKLLGNRRRLSGDLFTMVLCILFAVFALSAVLFWVHYWLLRQELLNRNQLENNARNLSARLLTLQDEERRRFSRELHDSVGQLLALAKMNLGVMFKAHPDDKILAETDKVVGEALSEIRTVSYLLHPPLLDELGLSSAIKWYLDGFAQRSGIHLHVDIDEDFGRLSHPTELVLFRALQESLTNVHRHSKSTKAEVSLHRMGNKVSLRVRDYGKGISSRTLKSFLRTDAETGVGLAGMREESGSNSASLKSSQTETAPLCWSPCQSQRLQWCRNRTPRHLPRAGLIFSGSILRDRETKEEKNREWSGRLDLNQRPHAPQACALPGCATSRPNRPTTSCRPVTSVSLAFEKGQDGEELFMQVEQEFPVRAGASLSFRSRHRPLFGVMPRVERGLASYAGSVASVLLGKVFSGARDREAFIVEQALDFENGLDVFAPVETMPARAFHGLKCGKFGFPIAQHKRLRRR